MIDYTAWRFWFDVLQVAATAFIALYVWWSGRTKVNARRFATFEKNMTALEKDIAARITREALDAIEAARLHRCDSHHARTDAIEGRLDHFEGEFKHLPGRKEIGELYKRLDGLNGNIERLAGRVEETNHQGRLVQETLLREGK